MGERGQHPHLVVAQDLELDVALHQFRAQHVALDGPRGSGLRHQGVKLLAEADLLAEGARPPLEGEGAHGHPPAVALAAHDKVGLGLGIVEERLVELHPAVDLHDGPDFDSGLVHGNQQVAETGVPLRARSAAGQHEDPVGVLGQRGPDLLAVQDPLAVALGGGGGHAGEVAARAGLRIALAPQLPCFQDRGHEALLLLGRPERHQGRPEQHHAHVGKPAGGARGGVGVEEHDLLGQRASPAADRFGKVEPEPSPRRELPLPGDLDFDRHVVLSGEAPAPVPGEFADQVLLEPGAHLVGEAGEPGVGPKIHQAGAYNRLDGRA